MIKEARLFAIRAHGDQLYGRKPYLYHLEKVVGHLNNYGDVAMTIGYLHDVVEDTEVKLEEIEAKFGSQVKACVELLTDEPGENRIERKLKTYRKMAAVESGGIQELGLIVKAADRLANLEECVLNSSQDVFKMYANEHQLFKDAVCRDSLCDDIWVKINAIVESF